MAMRKRKVKKERVSAQPKFCIIWCPTSDKPPRIRFNVKKAKEVANTMVQKYGQEFFVMQSLTLHRPGVPEVVSFTGREKKPASAKLTDIIRAQDPDFKVQYGCRQGASWTAEEDRWLKFYFHRRESVQQLAKRMGRTMLAIQYRLDHLGLKRMADWERVFD